MQFYEPGFLNLLWLAPGLAFLFLASSWILNKRVGSFLKTSEIKKKILPHYEQSEWPVRAVLLLTAFIFSVLALSQPQWGEEKKKIERKGVDIIFMLDVSTSMLAEDIKPSRVQKAKFEIESFVQHLKGDRIGMLTFAGSSFMQTPLTLDYAAFLIFLSGVDVGHVPDPGTSLGPAIEKALEGFKDEKGKYRALIVFSDGEDHELQIDSAIETAKKKSVRVYTVGTATAEGAPIPLKNEQGTQTAVKKDRAGNIVITKLNKEILSKAAAETGGIYLPATPGEKEIELILKHLGSLGVKKLEDRVVTEREEHYQIFVFLALLCLILEMLVRRGKSPRSMSLSALLIFFMLHSGFLPTPQKKIDEGNEDFTGKRFQSAVQKYREVQVKNPDSPPVEYNLATSLYKVDQFQESAAHLKNAVEKSAQDPELQAKAAYNYGNALYRVGDFEGAIQSYKKALELNSKDNDAKYNLEFLLDKKSKFEKENQERKKNNPEQKKDKDKDQQNKQNQNQSGGSNQDKKDQNSGGGKDKDQKDSGGGGDSQNKDQGQKNEDQQSGGQNNQNSAGQKEDPSQKDQGQGKNQEDQKQQGNESEPDKKPDENAGGQGEPEQKENQNQSEKNKGEQEGKNQNQEQKDPGQDPSQGQNDQPDQNQKKPENDSNKQDQPKNSGDKGQKPGQQLEPGKDQPGQSSGGAGDKQGQGQPGQGQAGKPLQGQMSKEDAEYLLGSLEDSERKFHVLRKPQENADAPEVEKDW